MSKSTRCLYHNQFTGFITDDEQSILGALCENYHGSVQSTQIEAWTSEISIMKELVSSLKDEQGQVIFEYDIPRLGKRIDIVLLLKGIIFVLNLRSERIIYWNLM